jgi:NADP-reducing hydrogenase subunit HndB
MGKMTLEELRKLREEKKKVVEKRDVSDKNVMIIVGMGTCGIAAGAKQTLDAFLDELDKRDIHNVVVKQTGCMGFCANEPTVEVKKPGMPDIVYGRVDDKIARKIVDRHIIQSRLVNEHVFDKPSTDIVG